MKRRIILRETDTITGQIYYETDKEFNSNISEHKRKFLAFCEQMYNKHMLSDSAGIRQSEICLCFPEIRQELNLPF